MRAASQLARAGAEADDAMRTRDAVIAAYEKRRDVYTERWLAFQGVAKKWAERGVSLPQIASWSGFSYDTIWRMVRGNGRPQRGAGGDRVRRKR